MKKQHEWTVKAQFKTIETHTEQKNEGMIKLNTNSGLKITSDFIKAGQPYSITQKELGLYDRQHCNK